ncbi:hypothetical protein D0Y65_050367 [Glycine soja]|uniref:Uncharacterized protein n=1 Tax=Glycine soja TaxID=3848 RepID=A0A445FBU9_GLYSO|nr:hypothetical protein D0Y65_050367 [Glycine soja]
MHIEKNFFDSIFNTVMNVSGKTKDNDKARMDLALYCRCKDLELKSAANGKLLKPKANYTLTANQTKFMGDSKRAVKNKAKVEGSICASYIHPETTYFCSHYFNNFMLSPHNIRNQIAIENERRPPMLSVFDQQGRPSGKELIHWLTDDEKDSAHVHVLINYAEVKPYLDAHNVRQVYYVPYLATRRDKRGWCVAIKTKPRGYIESDHVHDDLPYRFDEMSHVNKVIEIENIYGLQDLRDMSSGGDDLSRPSSHDSSGKGRIEKKKRYVVRLLPPRDSLPSTTPSPSSMSMPVRPLDVAATPSPPPTEARPFSSHVDAPGPSTVPAFTPSPSSVDARGPSPIPRSTPSPSPAVANTPTNEDATNLAMEDLPP